MDETHNELDIGAALKTAREQAGYSIDDVVSEICLQRHIIEHLEANEFSEISAAPVFMRGYISNYARYLKLNEQALLAAFDRQKRPPPELRLTSVNISSSAREIRSERRFSLVYVLLIIAFIIFLAFQLLSDQSWLARFISRNAPEKTQVEQPLLLPIPEQETVVPEDTLTQPPLVLNDPFPEQTPNSTSLAAQLPNSNLLVSESTSSSQNPDLERLLQNVAENNAMETVVPEETPVPEPAAESVVAPVRSITLHFMDDCWAEFRKRDGDLIGKRLYPAGESLKFTAEQMPIRAVIGRPDVVRVQIGEQPVEINRFRQTGTKHSYLIELTKE